MNNVLLSICIPTYNRKEVVIKDISEYLSLKDERFNIIIHDNNSTDGTFEELSLIKDTHLIVRRSPINIGASQNFIKSMSGSIAEYILLTIDKDLIDIKYLPSFLDYLEKEKPFFGLVDLSNNKPLHIENYPVGIKSIAQTAYFSKHQSGTFYKNSLFKAQIQQDYFKQSNRNFEFLFDVINGHLSVSYPASVVFMPLIINNGLRKMRVKSLTYNEDNIYYSCPKRLEAFHIYLTDFLSLELSEKEKWDYSYKMLDRVIIMVTVVLRSCIKNELFCEQYSVKKRTVSVSEMIRNSILAIHEFRTISAVLLSPTIINYYSIKAFIKSLFRIAKRLIKEVVFSMHKQ